MANLESAFINGKKIYLRSISESDLTGNYLRWFNDSDVTEHMIKGTYPTTINDLRRYYDQVILSQKNLILAVIEKENDEHIGNIGLHEINFLHQNAEMGICLGEKRYWGKGMAKEAIALICHHGFQQLNMQRIELGVLATHRSAIRSYEAIGFKNEGIKRNKVYKNGEFVDVIMMAMLKDELNRDFL
ncbi:hypothetical protein ASG89_29050 [Paenibacillus sp. Soil766]|uniref:GNAT family N-acetyltransferase n=1 Tax=Paenibacillus sp. Soil766 TaxID=1736404 RepID=UPI00070DBE30|nr:GNAT family protein [Paenibacillus sp. Soil766]KRE97953.1 hypothetical protein ASG89_29050 [Paenibacillus sp. Soil766]